MLSQIVALTFLFSSPITLSQDEELLRKLDLIRRRVDQLLDNYTQIEIAAVAPNELEELWRIYKEFTALHAETRELVLKEKAPAFIIGNRLTQAVKMSSSLASRVRAVQYLQPQNAFEAKRMAEARITAARRIELEERAKREIELGLLRSRNTAEVGGTTR